MPQATSAAESIKGWSEQMPPRGWDPIPEPATPSLHSGGEEEEEAPHAEEELVPS